VRHPHKEKSRVQAEGGVTESLRPEETCCTWGCSVLTEGMVLLGHSGGVGCGGGRQP
jgi:hypothetical protein